jgi:flagellar basal-body rod modification protein FlgD
MALNGIGSNSNLSNAVSSAVGPGSSNLISEQAFLQLLITQLKNQDPTNPADPTQFVSQLASFSSLEQMTQLNKQMTEVLDQSVTGLIGKTVTVTEPNVQGGLLQGVVSGIVYYKNGPAVVVNGNHYAIGDVQNVQ